MQIVGITNSVCSLNLTFNNKYASFEHKIWPVFRLLVICHIFGAIQIPIGCMSHFLSCADQFLLNIVVLALVDRTNDIDDNMLLLEVVLALRSFILKEMP